jgi:Ice-binding-like
MRRVLFKARFLWFVVFAVVAGVWPLAAQAASGPTPPPLKTAGNFAVLASSTITNTGLTVINGDLGLSPGGSVTGFGPGIVNGTQHIADAVAAQAQLDLGTAYDAAVAAPPTSNLSGQDLGGLTLTPGVYHFDSSAQLTGSLILSGNGVFIFQMTDSTLTTAAGSLASHSSVLLTHGAQACAVYWQVGSSATIGTSTAFVGTIMAQASITMNTGATLNGRALARNGAVTLDTNTITNTCGNPVKCTKGGDNDEDKDAGKSNDAADRNESVKGVTAGASNGSHDDGNKGCDSGHRDKDKDKDKDKD